MSLRGWLACCQGCELFGMVQEDKLEPSEQLGDLLRSAGDRDAALNCYRSANVPTKVIEGMLAIHTFPAHATSTV